MPATRDATRVLFLGGLGRSGTTLLERLIDQQRAVAALGEVVHLWQRSLKDDELCGCGERFRECPFWSEVGTRAFGGWDNVDADRVLDLRDRVDRSRRVAKVASGLASPAWKRDLREYVSYYERLYAAAARVSRCDVVLDSSKQASLPYCLSTSDRIDLRVVHCLRDSRAVAYSWGQEVLRPESSTVEGREMHRYSPGVAGFYWLLHNAEIDLFGMGHETLRLRYEDWVADPRASLRDVTRFAGLPPEADEEEGRSGLEFDLGLSHTCSGNPMRFTRGPIRLRSDDRWRRQMNRRDVFTVSAVTWPLLRRYGYLGARAPRQRPDGAVMTGNIRQHGTVAEAQARPAHGEVTAGMSPGVSVVVATRDRPDMVREAIESILSQTFEGDIEVIVVADQSDPDVELVRSDAHRAVRVIRNNRSSGLAGARNTGIEAARGEFVAFCDDDDYWLPGKLARQVELLAEVPEAALCTCGIEVQYDHDAYPRILQQDRVTFEELLKDRHTELHPSTFLLRRRAVLDHVGFVDEGVPGGFGEDYDYLLRAARFHPVVNVREPLTVVRWGKQSFFFRRWETMAAGLTWLLERHPEFEGSAAGSARIKGQIGFAHAAMGNRRTALRWAAQAARRNPREPRVLLTLAVASGAFTPDFVMERLHRRGRGI